MFTAARPNRCRATATRAAARPTRAPDPTVVDLLRRGAAVWSPLFHAGAGGYPVRRVTTAHPGPARPGLPTGRRDRVLARPFPTDPLGPPVAARARRPTGAPDRPPRSARLAAGIRATGAAPGARTGPNHLSRSRRALGRRDVRLGDWAGAGRHLDRAGGHRVCRLPLLRCPAG